MLTFAPTTIMGLTLRGYRKIIILSALCVVFVVGKHKDYLAYAGLFILISSIWSCKKSINYCKLHVS